MKIGKELFALLENGIILSAAGRKFCLLDSSHLIWVNFETAITVDQFIESYGKEEFTIESERLGE